MTLPRVGIFIDGPNNHATNKALGIDVDYKRFRDALARSGRLIRAYYLTGVVIYDDNPEYQGIRKLVDWLSYNGFDVVTKVAKEQTRADGTKHVKCNMDVELTCLALDMAPHIDRAVIVSGDGDFAPLVESLKKRGVVTEVVSTIQVSPPMCADDLRRKADYFTDIADIEPLIRRVNRPALGPVDGARVARA